MIGSVASSLSESLGVVDSRRQAQTSVLPVSC